MYEYQAKITKVVDGDTLDLEIDLGLNVFVRERVRLARVNTPETYGVKKESEEYAAGKAATDRVIHLSQKYKTCRVQTLKDKKGKYGRYIAEIWFTEGDHEFNLSDHLVEEGLAEYVTY